MDSMDLLEDGARTEVIGDGSEIFNIAIIGIGCRFPGGISSASDYWDTLINKRCNIRKIPEERWNLNNYYDPDPEAAGKSYSQWGGFLTDDVFQFDPAFFDMAPREVLSMDPQQRLLLQVAYEAIQDAGVPLKALQKARTGVFVGISTNDFGLSLRARRVASDIFAGTGSAYSIAANRISHRLDFHGPSIAVDTACSSALVAVDQAIRNLAMDTCDVALAGGVNCLLDPSPFAAFSSANMLSPTGAIYTFDARANGFVRGEGCGLVLLKPLARAVRDGDRIYGVIRGSAVNQDGRTPTLTAPSDVAQTAMLESLVAHTGLDPEDVGFVEAHGTGTPIGDPIEASAIGRVFGSRRADNAVRVGSFKPNLGHLESASGIAGLIKIVLSTHHGIVPPNLNFERPNPAIPFDALGLTVPVEPTPYGGEHDVNLAVVNSFGFGGTNACVAVESWRGGGAKRLSARRAKEAPAEPVFIPVSANSKAGLALWAGSLADALEPTGPLAEVSYAHLSADLRHARDHLSERAVILVDAAKRDLPQKLRLLAAGQDEPESETKAGPHIITGRAGARRLAFTFSGQGGQWWAMARYLLQNNPTYRAFADTFDEILRPVSGWSVVEEMLRDEDKTRINDADVTQASIFCNQVGLYRIWRERGLTPELLIGHSFGEVAATHIAGCIDLETCARIIYHRGRIPHQSTRRGAMATLGITYDQLAPLLPEDESVVVGAFNGPTANTVTGMEAAVEALVAEVKRLYPDALARRLTMDFGWHSPHLDDCEAYFRAGLGEVSFKDPTIPVVSTVTAMFETRFDTEYWWQNLRRPVSYKASIDFCLDLGIDTFLEMGPHRTVTPLIRGIAGERGAPVVAVSSLERGGDDALVMAQSMATLYVNGVAFDWTERSEEGAAEPLALPKRPWANERLVQLPLEARKALFDPDRHPLLGWRESGPEPAWTNEIGLKSFKYLADHRAGGDTLFPTVGYVEMMVAALTEIAGEGPVELRDFKIMDALSISEDDAVVLRTSYDPVTSRLRISSLKRDTDETWHLRAEAYGWQHAFSLPAASFDPAQLAAPSAISREDFYRLALRHGLDYGPTFQALDALWVTGPESALARISSAEAQRRPGFIAFPGLLDSVLQAGIIVDDADAGLWTPGEPLPEEETVPGGYPLKLPIGIRKILVAGRLPSEVITEFHAQRGDHSGVYRIYAPDGTPLMAIENLYVKTLNGRSGARDANGCVVIEEHFEASEPASPPVNRLGRWLLVTGDAAATAPLQAALEAAGNTVDVTDAAPFRAMETDAAHALVAARLAEPEGLTGIVFAATAGRHLPSGAELSTPALLDAVESATIALVTLGQVLDRMRAAPVRPALVVLGNGGRPVPPDGPMSEIGLADAALLGTTRTIANECQEFVVRHVDADALAFAEGAVLAGAVLEDSAETEIVLRGTGRFVPRLGQTRLDEMAPQHRTIRRDRDAANFTITMTNPGLIDNVVLRECPMPEPGAGEVIVEVAAVGLNFRDIMAATGILPDELEGPDAWWRNLGLEFSGTVVAVGAAAGDFQVGDRVMGMGKGFLRRYAAANARFLMRVPETVDLVSAATLPTAFMTAHYSLVDVGRLAEKEKVLVHLATGGVGLAAIQVANSVGAEIFASAGSDTKRDHLRALGITQVMNSRSLEFAEEVRGATGGRGVDVVLNALSGAGIDKGLECLAPFGRFVEIGKRDLAQDKPIGLKSLYCNNSYSVIDLSTIAQERPERLERLLADVAEHVAQGIYRPLTATPFPVSRTADAMRLLSKAQHIGKVVVTFDEPEVEVELALDQPMRLSADASYLVTGGLRGFGVAVADGLSRQGAGRLLLAGRNGTPDAAAEPVLAAIAARGTEIVPVALDVSDPAAVDALIAAHAHSDKPLRGIIHGAAVIEDGFLSQLDQGQIERVIRPKAGGAWNLHRALEAHKAEVDFFASFSSMAQVLGSAGQANYTAANSVLNALASYRKSRGLPGSAVAWGAIAGSGFVARSEALGNYLESIGMKPVADTEAVASLQTLLRAQDETPCFCRADWAAIGRTLARAAQSARVKPLAAQRAGGRSRIQAELVAAPREAWEGLLVDLIRTEVAKVLKVAAADIPADRRLVELGLDSLSSFELKNRIEAHVDVNIPVAKFLQTPTIAGLAGVVATTFETVLKARAASAAASGTIDGGSAGVEGKAAFRPLARQEMALALPGRPMTSPVAAAACETALSRPCAAGLDFEALARGLAAVVAAQEALRLVATPGGAIELGAGPDLEWVTGADDLRPIALPGPLWRFGVSRENDGGLALHVRAHRAAADRLSPHLALAQLLEATRTGTAAPPETAFTAFATSARPAEGSPEHLRHLAFWKEVLHGVPPALVQPGRARAIAPAGFGINRGPVGHLGARVAFAGFGALPPADQEATLITALARSLAARYGVGGLVIEHHDAGRGDAPMDLIGPLSASVPLVLDALTLSGPRVVPRVRRILAIARDHRVFDTAMIEALLARELNRAGASLRQVGFSFLPADRRDKLAAAGLADPLLALGDSFNEMRWDMAAEADGIRLSLAVDSAVLDEAEARGAVARFATALDELAARDTAGDAAPSGTQVSDIAWQAPAAAPAVPKRPMPGAAAPASPAAASRPHDVPVSLKQGMVLRPLLKADTNDAYRIGWTLGRAFRIQPRLDIERLRRALLAVEERQEALRTRFAVEDDGSLRAYLVPPGDPPFVVEELDGVDTATARAEALHNTPIDPFGGPLYGVTVLRCGTEGDIILALGHHAIFDGWSLGLFVEEMFQAFLGLPLSPVEVGVEEYVRTFERAGDPVAMAERDAYLRALYGATPPPLPNLGRRAKGLVPNLHLNRGARIGELIAFTTPAGQERLQGRARAAGVTETALLSAAYASTLAAHGGVDEVMVGMPVAMRTDARLTNVINWVAGVALLRADPGAHGGLEGLAGALTEQLNRAMPLLPFDYTFTDGALHDEIIAAGSYLDLYQVGMLAPDRMVRGAATSALQRQGQDESMDFGHIRITPVGSAHLRRWGVFEIDLRSFQSSQGLTYRFTYDSTAFTGGEAKEMFGEVLDRMGLGGDGRDPLVDVDGDQ